MTTEQQKKPRALSFSSLSLSKAKALRASFPLFHAKKAKPIPTKSRDELEILYAISTAVSSTLKLDNLFQVVLKQVTQHLGYDRALILLMDREKRILHRGKIRGAPLKVRKSLEGLEIPIDLQYNVLDTVIRKRQSYIANPKDIEQAIGFEREMVEFLKTKSFCVFPLTIKKRLVGILWVDYVKQDREILDKDIHLLEQVASQVAIAIDHAQAYQTISDLNEHLEEKVTERTRDLERTGFKLKEAFKTLKELDHLKNRFFTNISHELRTPLTLLLSPIELLLDNKKIRGKERQILSTVRANARQLLKMINALLDLTKIKAGKMHLRFQKIDIVKNISGICDRIRPSAEAKGVTLILDANPSCMLFVDPDQFVIILQNLLANALKFTESGGTVRVTLREESDFIEVEVRDTGIGISHGDLPHIFDRFSQGQAMRSLGTGIGLSLAYELTELHGGNLTARSVVGSGTVMMLQLKKGKDHLRPEWIIDVEKTEKFPSKIMATKANELWYSKQKVQEELGEQIPKEDQIGWRILVVEDHPDMLAYIKYILSSRYQILTASNGHKGFELAKKEQPDLVVTDVSMQGMDGYGLCEALKKDPSVSHMPVIFLTAHADPDGLVRALESYGADDYVSKPFHARELLARVERLLRLRELQAQLLQADRLASLGQLSAGLAHEVNNPLGFIKSGVSSLRKNIEKVHSKGSLQSKNPGKEFRDQAEWVLNRMEQGIDRIHKLIRGLQDYSRKDSGVFQQISLKRELDLCLQILGPKIREKELLIQVDIKQTPLIFGRGSQLGQVLMNLIHNAIQAVEKGGQIEIKARKSATRHLKEEVEIQVKDNGPGIPKENLQRIFNPFFTTKDPGEGLGLGLPICDQIIRSHGGTLSVESRRNEGSIFSIKLPQNPLRPHPASLVSEVSGTS